MNKKLKAFLTVEPLDSDGYRKFALIFAALVVIIFGFFLPWLFSFARPVWPWIFAVVIAVVAFTKPMWIWYLYKPWMIFGQIMGAINAKLLLSIAFFLVVTPTALIFKIRRKHLLARQPDSSLASYWKKADKVDPDHMRNIY